MNIFAYAALIGWIPVTFALFQMFPGRRAVMMSILGGWLFLPVAAIPVPGLPDLTKLSVVSVGALLPALCFDGATVFSLRPRWFDLPMLCWCIWPMPSSLLAGLDPYAAFAAALDQTIWWGPPYLLGRVYFADRAALGELLRSLAVAGMVYVPFCLWEVRMSPNLHQIVYGFGQHQFMQTMRGGGWRPQVFLPHGLAVGLLMGAATLAALGLWQARVQRPIFHLGIRLSTLLLVITVLLVKSTGALVLTGVGAAVLLIARRGRHLWPAYLLLLLAPMVAGGRITGVVQKDTVLRSLDGVFSASRTGSLRMRLDTEDTLLAAARARMLTGSGAWGQYRVSAAGEELVSATDGYWIITLGKYGLIGLSAWFLVFLVPVILSLRGLRRVPGTEASRAVILAFGVILTIYVLDALSNAQPNPMFMLIVGAMLGALPTTGSRVPVPVRA